MKRCIGFFVLMIFVPVAFAGSLDPKVEDYLRDAAPNELITVMAALTDRLDVSALSASLDVRGASRHERSVEIVTALQQKAAETQGLLAEFLIDGQTNGSVKRFEGFWIDNFVSLTATPEVIRAVAARADVAVVFFEPEILYDPPIDYSESSSQVNNTEIGLRRINAHKLWKIGYRGEGSLVLGIDTGVHGSHPALAARWRGTQPGVLPQHAWNGPGTFPVDGDGHGSHTMGTMCGMDPATGDTVGVAPSSLWIAGTGTYSSVFQWAVNPDGNPSTTDDIPDVINCSWFTYGDQCTGGSTYWSLMDNVEAVGAVVVWSAGNCGPSGSASTCANGGVIPGPYKTITPPKNRVATDVNAFSVGALDGNNNGLPIASFSSRGPSACDTTFIKPNVSAPGVSVRSASPSGGYAVLGGTSMAAPHVAGTVALLRQVNPSASVDMVKQALMASARDLGDPGRDNAYGSGIIDAFAAAEFISPRRLSGQVVSAQTLDPINLANVEIIETDQQYVTDTTGTYELGVLQDSVTMTFSAFGYADSVLVTVIPAGVTVINISLNPVPTVALAGSVTDSLSGQGVLTDLEMYAYDDPTGGPTYSVSTQANGSYSVQVFPGIYRIEFSPPAPYLDHFIQDSMTVSTSGGTADFHLQEVEVLIVDDDAGASFQSTYENSIDHMARRRRTFAVADSGSTPAVVLSLFSQQPVLLWFTGSDTTDALTTAERQVIIDHLNNGGRAIITGQNIAQYSQPSDNLLAGHLGIQYDGTATGIFIRGYAGDVIGNGVNYIALGGVNAQTSMDILSYVGGSIGTATPTLYYPVGNDTTVVAAVRVQGPGGWGVAYYGFGLEGLTPARQDSLIVRSFRYFDQIVTGVETPSTDALPMTYVLDQNYPNPFNPTTQIRYGLPQQSQVQIRVFDLLGREVALLQDGEQQAGYHSVLWTGETSSGHSVASGIYFYRIDANSVNGRGFISMKKMMLLK